jgi:hypothetical protein
MLEFDAETHTYRFAGKIVPSVTGVLRAIDNFDHVPAELLERARKFGQHVHAATDLFDRGILDEEDLDPLLLPYLNAYKLFLSESGFVVEHSEEKVYSARHKYAGTLDKRGKWKKTSWLVDLKSGAVPRSVGPQTAGYQQACAEPPRRRLCLQLKRNAYKLIACEDASDWHLFLSCLNINHFNARTINSGQRLDEYAA